MLGNFGRSFLFRVLGADRAGERCAEGARFGSCGLRAEFGEGGGERRRKGKVGAHIRGLRMGTGFSRREAGTRGEKLRAEIGKLKSVGGRDGEKLRAGGFTTGSSALELHGGVMKARAEARRTLRGWPFDRGSSLEGTAQAVREDDNEVEDEEENGCACDQM